VAATIRDVARVAGVSAATVSLVVNGGADRVRIAQATRQRVLTAAEALGYVADPRVLALRRGATRTILAAFVAREVPDAFFVDILHALDAAAARRGRDVQFRLIRPAAADGEDGSHGDGSGGDGDGSGGDGDGSGGDANGWDALRAASKAAAGVVLVGSLPPRAAGEARPRPRLPVPAVQIGSGDGLPGVSVVRVDNRHAGRTVAEHLLTLGHRTTAVLGPRTWYAPFVERREGYLEVVRGAGAPEPLVVSQPRPDPRTVARLRAAGVSAVVCLYDRLALALLRQARRAGVRIPEEWSLAGFDDMDWSALLAPSLTTVRIPRARLAAAAVERLEALIAGGAPGEPLVIAPELIARESTVRRGA
jgi:DNA-binding LacI/PurR family transcriptional regulator